MASNPKVIITNPQTVIKIPSGTRMLVRRSCHAALEYEQYDRRIDVNVVFADNRILHSYDDHRVSNIEAPEVIALPSEEEGCLGTLIISVERVTVVFASVHGILNLLGQHYSDQETKEAQMYKEARILTELGYSPIVGF